MPDYNKVDTVARCLAIQDGNFISAVEWQGTVGAGYRNKSIKLLQTIDRYDHGQRSGGLPNSHVNRQSR